MVPVSGSLAEVPVEGVEISFEFTREIILPDNISADVSFSGGALSASYGKDKSVLVLRPEGKLSHFTKYSISIGAGEHFGVNLLESSRVEFTTAYNPADKFERLPDEELLTLVHSHISRKRIVRGGYTRIQGNARKFIVLCLLILLGGTSH